MRKLYTNILLSTDKTRLPSLDRAGIGYELKIDATQGKYPYFTFSEVHLARDEDYQRALVLISQADRQ